MFVPAPEERCGNFHLQHSRKNCNERLVTIFMFYSLSISLRTTSASIVFTLKWFLPQQLLLFPLCLKWAWGSACTRCAGAGRAGIPPMPVFLLKSWGWFTTADMGKQTPSHWGFCLFHRHESCVAPHTHNWQEFRMSPSGLPFFSTPYSLLSMGEVGHASLGMSHCAKPTPFDGSGLWHAVGLKWKLGKQDSVFTKSRRLGGGSRPTLIIHAARWCGELDISLAPHYYYF